MYAYNHVYLYVSVLLFVVRLFNQDVLLIVYFLVSTFFCSRAECGTSKQILPWL